MRSVVVPTNRLIDPNDTVRRDIERRQGIQSSRDLARKIQRIRRSGKDTSVRLYDSSNVVEERAQEIGFSGNVLTLSRTGRRTTVGVTASPLVHVHSESDVASLVADLASKASLVHTHTESDVTGLVADLALKQGKDAGYFNPPGPDVVNTTNLTALVTGQCAARYLGYTPNAVTSIVVEVLVATAAATITWAEAALVSAPSPTSGTLTLLGFQSVATTFNSTGQKTLTFAVSIPAGTYVYFVAGSSATTPFQLRATLQDEFGIGFVRLASVRPSTGLPAAFTSSTAVTGAMACYPRWS